MRIYSNQQDNSETLSILKQYEGTDLWVKCYVKHVYDEDLGDLDGNCYIKVLKIFNRSCRVKCMPLSDGWEHVFDPEDLLEIVMENSYSVQIKNINFNIDWSAPDTYTDDEIHQLLETAVEDNELDLYDMIDYIDDNWDNLGCGEKMSRREAADYLGHSVSGMSKEEIDDEVSELQKAYYVDGEATEQEIIDKYNYMISIK